MPRAITRACVAFPRALAADQRQLDEAMVCHVGLVSGEQPIVIPTIQLRIGNELFIHGSAASRMLVNGGAGARLCVTVTLVDGVVLARSALSRAS